MRITNKTNLPEALVKCVLADNRERGDSDYTVTELLAPPRQRVLMNRHHNELTQDVADMIYAYLGRVGHALFEKARVDGDVVETRVKSKVSGFKISGQFDRLVQSDTLIDLKLMSVWEIVFGLKEEKIWQLNMYKYLAEQNGFRVKELAILGILRDWSIGKAELARMQGKTDYPQKQVVWIPVPVKSEKEVIAYIKERISLHERAINTPNWLPECSDYDRWAKDDTWALHRDTRKSALRVMDDRDKLEQFALDNNFAILDKDGRWEGRKGIYIEHRKGESVRCKHYCAAFPVCNQGQKIVAEASEKESEAA